MTSITSAGDFLSRAEAYRALCLADLLCRRSDEDEDMTIASADLELVALGLFLIVHLSAYAPMISEFTAGKA